MLACDPAWGRDHLDALDIGSDPWLRYAGTHTEPLLIDGRICHGDGSARHAGLATCEGFKSTLLVPAHSAPGRSRVSLLCLGSSTPGYFDGDEVHALRFAARGLAMDLHEWWLARMRRELASRARLNADDLALLGHQIQGHGSKRIAETMQVSIGSINSRFQRLNLKLGVANRRQAAQLAVECGLLSEMNHGSAGADAGGQAATASARSSTAKDRRASG